MKKKLLITAGIVAALLAGAGLWGWSVAGATYDGPDEVRIKLPRGITAEAMHDTLTARLGESFGGKVSTIFHLRDGDVQRAEGMYVILPGDRAWSVANRLRTGTQTPIRVTFNNIRTFDQLAARISTPFEWDSTAFVAAADTVLPACGYATPEEFPAAFLPDTYEFYWNASPDKVIRKLADADAAFWNESRRSKATALGLTPVQVVTLASIVEEETAKSDERGKVARLYLNRLARGQKLQADPTVKFAVGDFSLRRIGGAMLDTPSPYNTYRVEGLPPGPIRIPDRSTVDAVLDAPQHDFLYMCARSDFSGYHDFATDYDTHLSNARAYQQALDKRNITLK